MGKVRCCRYGLPARISRTSQHHVCDASTLWTHKSPAADYTRGLTHQPFIPLCAYWTQYKNGIAPRGKAPRRDPYRQDSESEDEGDMPITHEDILLMQDSAAGFLTGLDLPYVACLPVQGQDCPCRHLSPASERPCRCLRTSLPSSCGRADPMLTIRLSHHPVSQSNFSRVPPNGSGRRKSGDSRWGRRQGRSLSINPGKQRATGFQK